MKTKKVFKQVRLQESLIKRLDALRGDASYNQYLMGLIMGLDID